MHVDEAKQAVRERVWARLERHHAAPAGVHGRIPAFFGADRAADRLAGLPEWRVAQVVKSVPDTAQEPVRALALRDRKMVYMAVPKLAADQPFYLLDPATLAVEPEEAAAKNVAARVGRRSRSFTVIIPVGHVDSSGAISPLTRLRRFQCLQPANRRVVEDGCDGRSA